MEGKYGATLDNYIIKEVPFPQSIAVQNIGGCWIPAAEIMKLIKDGHPGKAFRARPKLQHPMERRLGPGDYPFLLLCFGKNETEKVADALKGKKRKFLDDVKTSIAKNNVVNGASIVLDHLPKRFRAEQMDMTWTFVSSAVDKMTETEFTAYNTHKAFPVSVSNNTWSGLNTFGIWWQERICVGLQMEAKSPISSTIESAEDFAVQKASQTWAWTSETGFDGILAQLDKHGSIQVDGGSMNGHAFFASLSLMSVFRVIEEIQVVKTYF
jgi:hypothetical protein